MIKMPIVIMSVDDGILPCPVCKTDEHLMFDYIYDVIKDVNDNPYKFIKFKVRCFNESCVNHHIQKEEYTIDPTRAIREWNYKCHIHDDLSIKLADIGDNKFAKIKEYLIKNATNINSDVIEAINLARHSNLELFSLFKLLNVDPKEYLDELSEEK